MFTIAHPIVQYIFSGPVGPVFSRVTPQDLRNYLLIAGLDRVCMVRQYGHGEADWIR